MADTKGNNRNKYVNRNQGARKKNNRIVREKQKQQNDLKEKILRC